MKGKMPSRTILYLLFFLPVFIYGQAVVCTPAYRSFMNGEHLKYTVSYNWGIIWINAGEVTFQTKQTVYDSKQVYHFFSTGYSFKRWDWLFKVRDTFEVYSRISDLQPLFSKRHTLEGGFRIRNQYRFFPDENKLIAKLDETRKDYRELTLPLESCTYDVLTATYLARSLPFDEYYIGDTIHISMVLDGQDFDLPIVLKGEEKIKNRGGEYWDCILFSAILDKGTMFRAGEELLVWVSNDAARIPVMMEAKITVGSIKIYLTEAINTKSQKK